jgi:hypothetical protein
MPLTRDERQLIEYLVKESGILGDKIKALEKQQEITEQALTNIQDSDNFLTLSDKDKIDAIRNAVEGITKSIPLRKHNHTSDSEGGDAYAAKGARLQ